MKNTRTANFSIEISKDKKVRDKIYNKINYSAYINSLIDKDLEQNKEIQPQKEVEDFKRLLKDNDREAYNYTRRVEHIEKVRSYLFKNIVRVNPEDLHKRKIEDVRSWLERQLNTAKKINAYEKDIREVENYIKLIDDNIAELIVAVIESRKLINELNYIRRKYGDDRIHRELNNNHNLEPIIKLNKNDLEKN